jgi:hypothetical protein
MTKKLLALYGLNRNYPSASSTLIGLGDEFNGVAKVSQAFD